MIDPQSTPAVTDAATKAATEVTVRAEATRLIVTAAERAGITVAQVPQTAVDEAYKFARESMASEAAKEANEYYHLSEAQKKEIEALKAQLGAVRENRAAKTDERVVPTMENVRDLMGRGAYYQLSEGQKLSANGIDPSVDRNRLRELFGRNPSTSAAVDLMKVDPFKYRQYREAAKILNITGK